MVLTESKLAKEQLFFHYLPRNSLKFFSAQLIVPNAGQWFPSDIRLLDRRFPEIIIAHLRQHPTYSPILILSKGDGSLNEKWAVITRTKCVREKGQQMPPLQIKDHRSPVGIISTIKDRNQEMSTRNNNLENAASFSKIK